MGSGRKVKRLIRYIVFMGKIEGAKIYSTGNNFSRKRPETGRDYGHQFEEDLALALKEQLTEVVEETELATRTEDRMQKVDFWLKLSEVENPIAVQVSFTTSGERYSEKERHVKRKPYARKEERNDSLINTDKWSDKVLVIHDKNRAKNGEIDSMMVKNTLNQIFQGLPQQTRGVIITKLGDRIKKAGIRLTS